MSNKQKEYLISYEFEGASWVVIVPCETFEEAKRRVRAIGLTGNVDGELVMTIPANVPLQFVGILVWLRNLIFGKRPTTNSER